MALALALALPAAPSLADEIPAFQGENRTAAERSLDLRAGSLAPTTAATAVARALGADVVWNVFGTPASMSKQGGMLSGPSSAPAAQVARDWAAAHADLFGLDAAELGALELIKDVALLDAPDLARLADGKAVANPNVSHVVMLRQSYDGVASATGGLLTVGVTAGGEVAYVSSSISPNTGVTNTRTLSAVQGWLKAAAEVGRTPGAGALSMITAKTAEGFTTYALDGVAEMQYTRPRALATPTQGVRLVWETVVLDSARATARGEEPTAWIHFVDAETGAVLKRENRVEHFADDAPNATSRPQWAVFPANPPLALPGESAAPGARQTWCWDLGSQCDRIVGFGSGAGNEFRNTASRFPWDVNVRTGRSSHTTEGNNADTAPSFASFLTPDAGQGFSPVAPDRNYTFPFGNEWFSNSCNPTNFTTGNRNDVDAATTNLFVGHNRMHDWSYYLGFTEANYNFQSSNFDNPQAVPGTVPGNGENDPEIGQSQSGAIGGGPTFQGRDNANQIALQDGIPGITNQYLWQPLQAGFYAPCVDGAYDFSVLGHEFGHGIQGRMVGGPDGGLSGAQAGSMNESWSDLNAMEYLNEFGFVPTNAENPFAVGAYVTGEQNSGIRNYGMNDSPLNYSNIEYDGNGLTSPHADGEIWSATNFTIREAMIAKYDSRYPSTDQDLQVRCADGILPADKCPGNRQWKQMVYDAYLLQQSSTSMVTARDALVAADVLRFGGANQDLLAEAFALRGFGAAATSNGTGDRDPTPSFASTTGNNVVVTFAPTGVGGDPAPADMKVYVGTFEARAVPAAVVSAGLGGTAEFVEGTYEFLATAPGYGAFRFAQSFVKGQAVTVEVPMRLNLASAVNGASATGDGVGADRLIDDTEATNWASLGSLSTGKQVTVQLAGIGAQTVKQVQVSSALHGAETSNTGDTGSQSRFSGLRSFEVLSCDTTTGSACAAPADFTSRFVSAPDAFPADRPRPTAPDLQLRGFDVPEFTATHVRLAVLANQCVGGPLYTGAANPDDDLVNDPDCVTGRTSAGATGGTTSLSQANNVRIAEFQVFSAPSPLLAVEEGPTPVIPEVPLALLLPLGALGLVALAVRRRRLTV